MVLHYAQKLAILLSPSCAKSLLVNSFANSDNLHNCVPVFYLSPKSIYDLVRPSLPGSPRNRKFLELESKEIFQLSICFRHLTMFGNVLLQELTFPFRIHWFLFIGQIASLFTEL